MIKRLDFDKNQIDVFEEVNHKHTIFTKDEFGEIRVVQLNNETYFVGKDVAEALGYANPKNAVPAHVSEEDKLSTQIEYAGQRREVTVINESGLYALIFGSKLESAKRFIKLIPRGSCDKMLKTLKIRRIWYGFNKLSRMWKTNK